MPVTFYFFDLPPELHLLIKDWISPSDLRTHVCFYLSAPQCASLYDSRPNPDNFWKLLCWNNGLGQLPDETETETTWRDIATRVIHADGFCTHPQCGEALLEYNRASMREAAKHGVQPFSPLHIRGSYDGDARTDLHRVVAHISFRPHTELRAWGVPSFPVERDAHLRSPGDVLVEWEGTDAANEREYLWRHPLAARSFATFAPTDSLFLFAVAGIDFQHDRISSARALTVLEVLDLIQKDLNLERTVYAVSSRYVSAHEGCISRHGWSMFEIMLRLRTLRGILSICPIQQVEVDEYTDAGPAFRFHLQ
ncbi:hypothetical protein LXA43DRAFT_888162 [Ganoderma leucocontextum]|nr:hypothetical protein LXA43DRAFT_888162 [Ganoderma leucocontextum]